MLRTFYAFFALMAIIGISSTAIESAKNTAYANQRVQRSSPIHDREWEFVKFGGHGEVYADIGGDPTDQRLGAHPIDVDVAGFEPRFANKVASSNPEPIDYAAIDASADPLTGEKYGCGLGQPIESPIQSTAATDSAKGTNPWANVCPVGLPSNYSEPSHSESKERESTESESNDLTRETIANDLVESIEQDGFAGSDPYLDWDCGMYLRRYASNPELRAEGRPDADSVSASESTPAADFTLSNPESASLPSQQAQDNFRFEYPEFVLEYLRQFSTAMQELENYAPRIELKSRVAEEYAAAENAAALAELRQDIEVVSVKPALPPLPVNQCDRGGAAYNELGYPSCGGYSPNWQQEATLSLATETETAPAMKIESVDPVVDVADDRWIGPEANFSEAELFDKVDGPLPALPCDLEIDSPEDSNSLANLMRLLVTIDPNLSRQSGPTLETEFQSEAIVENGLWSGRDFDFPGCDDAGEIVVTQNGWTKEALALDDRQREEFEAGQHTRLELDPIFAWLGENVQAAWNWGNEALDSLHHQSDEVSSARSNWLETR